MTNPVEFRLAISHSFPTGMESFGYKGFFDIVVQNIGPLAEVSINENINAAFVESLPGERELWRAAATNTEEKFFAKYTVLERTFVDDNEGSLYIFPRVFDSFAALTGVYYKVVLGSAAIQDGILSIFAWVQNLAFEKEVEARYTIDREQTERSALGNFHNTQSSGLEVWEIKAPVGEATTVTFRLFYRVLGKEFFDDNFDRKYTVTKMAPIDNADPAARSAAHWAQTGSIHE